MADGNTNRQYQGFSYPAAPPASGAGALPPGGMPYYGGSGPTAGATGLVRRTTGGAAAAAAAAGGGGAVGYGYFHRAASSGGHSGFAAGSDAGSSHGHRAGLRQASAVAVVPTTSPGYPYPQSPPHSTDGQGLSSNRPPAVQVRVGGGDASAGSAATSANAYPLTPTVVIDTRNSSNTGSGFHHHTVQGGGAVPWGSSASPHQQKQQQAPYAPHPHTASTAISFLPPSNTLPSNDAATLVDEEDSAAVVGVAAGDGVVPINGAVSHAREYASHPAASPSPFFPAPILDSSATTHYGGGGGGYPRPTAPQAPPPPAAKGFFKDMMNRLLSDLDENGNAVGADAGGARRDEPLPLHQTRFGCPEDDLPLLEELGIYPSHIWKKARAVLNPFRPMPTESVEDTDLAGPLVFAVALAFLLSLQGKIQFSAIYGLSVLGVSLFKALLTLMHSPGSSSSSSGGVPGAPLQFIISSLGYALLPSLVLALLRTVQFWVAGSYSAYLLPLAFVVIAWSSWCATSLLVRGLGMEPQRYLILYPMLLFYSLFAALTIF